MLSYCPNFGTAARPAISILWLRFGYGYLPSGVRTPTQASRTWW
jgi:hypothetical protein